MPMTTEPLHIRAISRAPQSRNGNPRYVLHTDAGDYRTEVDGSIGYSIPNLTNRRFPDTYAIGDDAPAVRLQLSRSGRYSHDSVCAVIR